MTKVTGKEVQATEFDTALPAHLQAAVESGQQRGSEDVSSDDLTIPRLQIIQALSPQKKKTNAAYIDGAEEGMAFNTATDFLYKDGLFLVPVYFRKEFLIWTKERTENNGFRGSYPTELIAMEALRELEDGPLCEISDTHQQFCLVVDPETKTAQEIVISMAKSQIKISKRFNTQIRLAGGDRFNMVYKFSVVDDKSDKGEFYNWGFKKVGYVPAWAYKQAEMMYDAVKSGSRDVSREHDEKPKSAPSQDTADTEFPDEM
jgi:hypothetical protein